MVMTTIGVLPGMVPARGWTQQVLWSNPDMNGIQLDVVVDDLSECARRCDRCNEKSANVPK